MSTHVFHRPGLTDAGKSPDHRPRKAPEDREWLILLGAVLVALLVFGAMVGLTALGGGTDYVPWSR